MVGVLWALWLTLAAPVWCLILASHHRLRSDLRHRLGWEVVPVSHGAVWVHASSVGEVSAAEALVNALTCQVLLTADTDTGVEAARCISSKSRGRVVASARPVDHPWTFSPLWAEARPRAVIFVEGVWWPGLAARCARDGVPLIRVSAKSGPRTRAVLWAPLYRFVTDATTHIIARDQENAEWFRTRTVATVEVGADLKSGRPLPENPLQIERDFIVAASTRGEEGFIVAAMEAWSQRSSAPLCVLAPRHRERFEAVAKTLEESGIKWERRSALKDGIPSADTSVLLLDTMGELAGCLNGAKAAFIGGTFDPRIGGHSPAEATVAGVTVVAGPQRWANQHAYSAASVVDVETPETLLEGLIQAVDARPMPKEKLDMNRVVGELSRWFNREPSVEVSPRPWACAMALIWGVLSTMRGWLYTYGLLPTYRASVSVIAVGSTNARGSGKTPCAIMLAREAQQLNHKVGIAVRGYRRTNQSRDVCLSIDTTEASELGDEGAVIAAQGFIVAAGPNRVATVQALEQLSVTLVILEDGLQHRKIDRDVEIAVVDGRSPKARGLIPMGERREWAVVPARVDGLLIQNSEGWEAPTGVPTRKVRRTPGPWYHGDAKITSGPQGPCAVVIGVGRPAEFVETLQMEVARVKVLQDHQPITTSDADTLLEWAGGLPIICTGKDRVRMPQQLRNRVWYRDIEASVEGGIPAEWLPPPRALPE